MVVVNDIPRGQLPMIVLLALKSGDKYGLEIISTIEEKTQGAIVVKQPSLYSALKRMEENKLISSYWLDSTIGGKRHYYTMSDLGKQSLEDWTNSPEQSESNFVSAFDSNALTPKDGLSQKVTVGPENTEAVVELHNNSEMVDSVNQENEVKDVQNNSVLESNKASFETKSESVIENDDKTKNNENLNDNKPVEESKTPLLDKILLEKTNNEKANKNNLNQTKVVKPVFVQNNLFNNFSQIGDTAEIASSEKNKVKEPVAPPQPKKPKEIFNIDKELQKIIIRPKSYFETVYDTNQSYVSGIKQAYEIKEEVSPVAEENNFEETIVAAPQQIKSDVENQEIIQPVKSSSLVTERISEENAFKVKKMPPPIFDIRPRNKFSGDKKLDTDPAIIQANQSQDEIDKLEIYFKAKNIQVKKYNKFASGKNSKFAKINFYTNNFIVALISTLFSLGVFAISYFSLNQLFEISQFEFWFSISTVIAIGTYLLINLLLRIIINQKKIFLPKKILHAKAILLTFVFSIITFAAMFLLLFSIDNTITNLIFKMLFVASCLLFLPFSVLSQKIVNKVFSQRLKK